MRDVPHQAVEKAIADWKGTGTSKPSERVTDTKGKATASGKDKHDGDTHDDTVDELVRLGREQVEDLVNSDPFGGLLCRYELHFPSRDMPIPLDRAELLKWIFSESPILVRLAEIA